MCLWEVCVVPVGGVRCACGRCALCLWVVCVLEMGVREVCVCACARVRDAQVGGWAMSVRARVCVCV